MSESISKEIECFVSGRVQMVMFRDFAKRKAYPLNIFGFVENLQNSSVRVVAQGREENLLKFIEHLRKGPFGAHVSHVDVNWREPSELFTDFSIRYT